MISIMDWILDKICLVDIEDEEIQEPENGQKVSVIRKPWLEFTRGEKEKMLKEERRVYFKAVKSYKDCKLLIDNCKMGATCIYHIDSDNNFCAKNLMNYLYGGIYALDGEIIDVGNNVFLVTMRKE